MLLMLLIAAAAAPEAKTSAMDDWHSMAITKVAASASPLYLWVSAGDLDGDGAADEAVIKLDCDGSAVSRSSFQIVSPRDSATGLATGKRMHKPFVMTKEWGTASPELSAMKPTYDVKAMKAARAAAGAEGWSPITLSTTDGLCTTAASSAAKITKSRSNIQNN